MIDKKGVKSRLEQTLATLKSDVFRTRLEGNGVTSAEKLDHAYLIWEIEHLIREIELKELKDELGELEKFNKRYKLTIKRLEKSLEEMQTLKNTLKNVEDFIALASRIFLLFSA